MLQTWQFNGALYDKAVPNFFSKSGALMAEEAIVLGEVAQALVDAGLQLTNKNIIVCLIKSLECTEDVVQADTIRKTLEVVMGYTLDDS
ncbi:biofilm development regulator YmgB/AriR family protein [Yokenella regensburgei]|uniref:biofilm development regulator YmgB/AriR family protein n=1 Tax=Yokenella regensburgei TaxID=158877 RepID=UPI001375697E|nr:biofilm development regulator YmgB/AriR family protein [Yokenella regensburgei]KAF1366701.1 hypothetical protein FHR25_004849 [Yokenella regensburgei]